MILSAGLISGGEKSFSARFEALRGCKLSRLFCNPARLSCSPLKSEGLLGRLSRITRRVSIGILIVLLSRRCFRFRECCQARNRCVAAERNALLLLPSPGGSRSVISTSKSSSVVSCFV